MRRHTTRLYASTTDARPAADKKTMLALCLLALSLSIFLLRPACVPKAHGAAAPPPMPASMQQEQRAPGITNSIAVQQTEQTDPDGKSVIVRTSHNTDVGIAVIDKNNGPLWFPATARQQPAGQADARELKLKIRELADQLIVNLDSAALKGALAIPTSFVNQDDFSQSSALGRYVAEQLYYELSQRGFPVREYRMAGAVRVSEDGEMILSRAPASVQVRDTKLMVIAGTYHVDRQAIFMNARLLRGADGQVARAAHIILPANALTRRMLAGTGKTLKAGAMSIKDFKSLTQPVNLTPFDRGEDIH